MKETTRAEKDWYTYGQMVFVTREAFEDAQGHWKFRWFRSEKAERYADFDWETVLDGKKLGTKRHARLVLMKRTWKSVRQQLPEKANKKRLREMKRKAEEADAR